MTGITISISDVRKEQIFIKKIHQNGTRRFFIKFL